MRPRAALALLVLAGAGAALALPGFRLTAIQQFHYDQGNPLWEYDRKVMSCAYCHVKESGGAPWNAFGQALQQQFRADAAAGRKNKFPAVLYDRLKLMQDADGDGYADALEVYARTLPGNPASTPTEPVAELGKAFAAAGGVAQYAPKVKKP